MSRVAKIDKFVQNMAVEIIRQLNFEDKKIQVGLYGPKANNYFYINKENEISLKPYPLCESRLELNISFELSGKNAYDISVRGLIPEKIWISKGFYMSRKRKRDWTLRQCMAAEIQSLTRTKNEDLIKRTLGRLVYKVLDFYLSY